jgi:ferrous iron transport protein A
VTLDTLQIDKTAKIKGLIPNESTDLLTGKLTDMGIYPGQEIKVLYKAPFGDPIAVDVEGYVLSLRKYEASLVEIA